MTRHLILAPALALAFAMMVLPGAAVAQTLTGRVTEDGSDRPVGGALLALVDRDGDRKADVLSDADGRFRLDPPEAGEYVLETTRIGYRTARSPLLALGVEGTASVSVELTPEPLGLAGLEVTVEREAEEFLRNLGHTPTSLGARWLDAETIEAMPYSPGPVELIRWASLPGVSIPEDECLTPARCELCVTFIRGRTFNGGDRCALVILDGLPVGREQAQQITPSDIAGLAILTPTDATTFYGTSAGGGAVVIWTKRGG